MGLTCGAGVAQSNSLNRIRTSCKHFPFSSNLFFREGVGLREWEGEEEMEEEEEEEEKEEEVRISLKVRLGSLLEKMD